MFAAGSSLPPDPGRSPLQRLRDWLDVLGQFDPVPEFYEGMSEKVARLGAAEAVAKAGVAAATIEMADLQTTHAEEKAALDVAHSAAIAEQTKKYNVAAEALAAREQETSRFLGQITNVLTAPR